MRCAGDEGDADHRTDEVGGEEPEHDVAPPEPAERQPEHRGEPDIAEAEQPGADQVHGVEEHEPGDAEITPIKSSCHCPVMPAAR